ncbi:MAG: hypothetical protein NC418_11820 [Muribaculaceae bacterium]|nr:hypothetical protein [Muribaculaceae bacterium]
MTANDHIDRYREVTAAERSALEKSDAEASAAGRGVRTPFTPLYERAGAKFNDATGYYEMNTLTDLTEDEMAYAYTMVDRSSDPLNVTSCLYRNFKGRTMFPITFHRSGGIGLSAEYLCTYNCFIQVIAFANSGGDADSFKNFALNCDNLHAVIGLTLSRYTARPFTNAFKGCRKLEHVWIRGVWADIDFSDSPLLSIASLEYMVANSFNVDNAHGRTDSTTLTLHPSAYARLTDELIAAAAERQITFATTE